MGTFQMNPERYKRILTKPNKTLKEALKIMDKAGMQALIITDDKNRLLGIVTDGNIRRAIIKGTDFDSPIDSIMTKNPIVIQYPANKSEALKLMKKHNIKHLPVIDEENKVIGLLQWNDFLNDEKIIYPSKDISVVIMAGGKGSRLDPFTKILPKSLIPIGNKPIIQLIMDNFKKYGFSKFIISLNYRAQMIKMYFSENANDYQIEYVQEKKFLGTAGSLLLIKDKLKHTFVVSNCDIVTDANFDSLLNYHKKNKNHVTILGAIRYIKIPFGVLKMQNANLDDIVEKPEYHFIINSGIYVLEPEVIDLITKNRLMNMPNLLLKAKKKRLKIQVYPISTSWFDVGEWEEYKKALEYIKRYGEFQ